MGGVGMGVNLIRLTGSAHSIASTGPPPTLEHAIVNVRFRPPTLVATAWVAMRYVYSHG